MASVPEFILRKLYVPNSFTRSENGFRFQLKNNIAPATLTAFKLFAAGEEIPVEAIIIYPPQSTPITGNLISAEQPFALSVGSNISIEVHQKDITADTITLEVDTVEIGLLKFSVRDEKKNQKKATAAKKFRLPEFLTAPLKATIDIDAEAVIGEIDPNVYGQFIEHLEDCIYDGIWTADGSELRQDTLELVKALKPPVIRYPGGNFASGYHWEDGIGPKADRPTRVDQAWQSEESNLVGTDEFMELCEVVHAEPFLVVNDATGTPEEAARWVAYCNDPADSEQGQRRAENGHPAPYQVKYWGVGNEVWGRWQIGHTDAKSYTERVRPIIEAMRAVDPNIKIIAVGDQVLQEDISDAGYQWNKIVLQELGDIIDYLSFHLYQPDQSGWRENYDTEALHRTVCAAPLAAEAIIRRIDEQIRIFASRQNIRVAFDEWNLWLSPPENAATMHKIPYNMRDAMYAAGMLNAFHRQCKSLGMANLAQLVNVLPLIMANAQKAVPTAIYYPFLMYQNMKSIALEAAVKGPKYSSEALGNIPALENVPYLDITATRSPNRQEIVVCLINRNPTRRVYATINFKNFGLVAPQKGWILRAENIEDENDFDHPNRLKVREIKMPESRAQDHFRLDVAPASIAMMRLKTVRV
jgi:alpha-N-arabinofuranosidase